MSSSEYRFRIRLQPRASRRGIEGMHGDALKVSVNAPPEGGKANAELIALLAKEFRCAKSDLAIVGGLTSRNKTIEVSNVDAAKAIRSLMQSDGETAS